MGTRPFYEVIQNDEECLKLHHQILEEIEHNQKQIELYHDVHWSPFKMQWELDKDRFMRKYEGVETSAATFDVNIGRYTEVANQVSLQESVTSVYFIVVNSNLLKNSILAHIDDWQKRHTDLLKKRAYDKITSKFFFIFTFGSLK